MPTKKTKPAAMSTPDTTNLYATPADFGPRLAALRKAAGYTQHEFADQLQITRRMYTYYESENHFPPPQVLALLASALNTSTDHLLGLTQAPGATRADFKQDAPAPGRFLRRLDSLLHLPKRDQDAVLKMIDTFVVMAQGKTARAA